MNTFKMYRSKPEDDEDDYTAEEVARHKKFMWTLCTTKKVVSTRSAEGW